MPEATSAKAKAKPTAAASFEATKFPKFDIPKTFATEDDYLKHISWGRRLRALWEVHGPEFLFLAVVVGWQGHVYGRARSARGRPQRGTRVTLHLMEDAKTYTERHTLERMVKAQSGHVPVPIAIIDKPGAEPAEVSDGAALWTKPKADITATDYTDFYRGLAGLFDEPGSAAFKSSSAESRWPRAIAMSARLSSVLGSFCDPGSRRRARSRAFC